MGKWTDLARTLESETLTPVQIAQLVQIAQPETGEGTACTPSGVAICTICTNCTAQCNCEWEERAAIAEYDGGLSRAEAEALATHCHGSREASEGAQLAEQRRLVVAHQVAGM